MALILASLFASAFGAFKKRWDLAHFFLAFVIIFKLIWSMVIFDYGTSNFEYFHLVPALAFLFTKNKLSQMRFLWAFVYFFTPFVKLDTGWILGTYFTTLRIGLPIFPDSWIPLITNLVIVFEMLCSVGLLSKNKKIAQTSLWGWTIFHLYSTILVGFFYPVRCLPMLWVLFGFRQYKEPALRVPLARSIPGIVLVLAIAAINLMPSFISKSPNETFEGMNYGLHMFNSNHQCLNTVTYYDREGHITGKEEFGSTNSMTRCYPQWTLQRLQKRCVSDGNRLSWSLIHSKNGEPFYEMVQVDDICKIEYRPFAHNKWLKTPETGAILKGYPERNSIYPRDSGGVPKIHAEQQIPLSALQSLLSGGFPALKMVYFVLWSALFFFLLKTYFVDGRNKRIP